MIEYTFENINKFADYLINKALTENEIKLFAKQFIEQKFRLKEEVFRETYNFYLGNKEI